MESEGQDTAARAGHSSMASGTAVHLSALLMASPCSQHGYPCFDMGGGPELRGRSALSLARRRGRALPERLCWPGQYCEAIAMTPPCLAGQWLPAPRELEGAASDGLDPAAKCHHEQWLHASHPRRPQGWEDVQAQLLCRWNLVRHTSCFTASP